MNLKKMKQGTSKTAIAFYVLSVLLLLAFFLTVYNVTIYIQSLLSAGSISLTGNWMDIALYYVNNSSSFLVFSALLFGMGYVIAYIKSQRVECLEETETQEEVIEQQSEEVTEQDVPTNDTEENQSGE